MSAAKLKILRWLVPSRKARVASKEIFWKATDPYSDEISVELKLFPRLIRLRLTLMFLKTISCFAVILIGK